jgi:hypothetical protein
MPYRDSVFWLNGGQPITLAMQIGDIQERTEEIAEHLGTGLLYWDEEEEQHNGILNKALLTSNNGLLYSILWALAQTPIHIMVSSPRGEISDAWIEWQ